MTTLHGTQRAHREYANRPADERHESVSALITAAGADKAHSLERRYNLHDLNVVATQTHNTPDFAPTPAEESIRLESPKGRAKLTHWSFGQLCRTVGAPAAYLRTLPAENIARDLNFGLHHQEAGTRANVLVRLPNGNGETEPVARACTSETYGRVWDADLYGNIARNVMDHDSQWTTPPTWTGEPAGAYRGDRDSFLIITNGGSIVHDPSLRAGNGAPDGGPSDGMYRGMLVRNSEVGACAIYIETILFRAICGNHLLWSATLDKQFRRRHTGPNAGRDAAQEISRIAWNWTQSSAARDEAIIKTLIDNELAHTKEAVIDELRKLGATLEQATQAYATCEQRENASPRSFWGLAQGMTRDSQETSYQDERYALDQLAAKILSVGLKRAAVKV